jgi:hypothetical protein
MLASTKKYDQTDGIIVVGHTDLEPSQISAKMKYISLLVFEALTWVFYTEKVLRKNSDCGLL